MTDKLGEYKKNFEVKKQPRLSKYLTQISGRRFKDAASLIQLHENLLFMLAYPQSEGLLAQTKEMLASFPGRIKYLKEIEADLSVFEDPEYSGIAATSITVMLGYKFAHWLSEYHKNEAEIAWESCEEESAIGSTLPRILPLLEEESLVETHTPFLEYIHTAKSKKAKDLEWFMKNFSHRDLSEKQKAELYDSLKLFIRLAPTFNSSRTGLKLNVRSIFYHDAPLIRGRDILLERELDKPTLQIKKLSLKEGLQMLGVIRIASAVRYRELHGFIWGDPKSFSRVDLGRGVSVFINEVLPGNRLPLRAYHSGFIFKNGIPVGYVEGLSLFEKMEIGFNLYYTFRDGETAWLYAQVLRIFTRHLGVTVFSVDPYQIGHENKEGIESAAFWFYRKLGFYPAQDDVMEIVKREEKKILKRSDYRTQSQTLLKIAKSHLYFEYRAQGKEVNKEGSHNPWNNFQIAKVMLAVHRRMSQEFDGNASKMRKATTQKVSRILNIDLNEMKLSERDAFESLALVLSLIRGFAKWSDEVKKLTVEMFRAKAGGSEVHYLKLMQQHTQFREALIEIGCGGI